MVLSKRLLRVAALGAVFALALAGTALAATYTWKEGVTSGAWNNPSNWTAGSGYPGDGDTAIFTKSAEITALGTPSKVKELKFEGTDNVTLTLDDGSDGTHNLEVQEITVAGDKQVTIDQTSKICFKSGMTNNPIVVGSGKDAKLTFEMYSQLMGSGNLELSGKGTLEMKVPVDGATGLKITQGGTLILKNYGKMPGLLGSEVVIEDGNLTLN